MKANRYWITWRSDAIICLKVTKNPYRWLVIIGFETKFQMAPFQVQIDAISNVILLISLCCTVKIFEVMHWITIAEKINKSIHNMKRQGFNILYGVPLCEICLCQRKSRMKFPIFLRKRENFSNVQKHMNNFSVKNS